jgi:hypothetical protein
MSLTKPLVDPKAFGESSPERYMNRLGPIDEALRKWAKAEGKGGASAQKQIARLLKIVVLCRNWLDNVNGEYRASDDDRPAVEALLRSCWKRAQWEQYNATKAQGAAPNLKALDGKHAFEAVAMNKQSYKGEHVGINSIDDILNGFSADRASNTELRVGEKALIKEVKHQLGVEKAKTVNDLDQRQCIEDVGAWEQLLVQQGWAVVRHPCRGLCRRAGVIRRRQVRELVRRRRQAGCHQPLDHLSRQPHSLRWSAGGETGQVDHDHQQ